MARRPKQQSTTSTGNSFRFEWVQWTPKQLTELKDWLDGNEDALEASLYSLADQGWKVSLSTNQRSGRYLVSLTDKWGRPGLSNVSYGIEHSDIRASIMGAVYYATQIIGDGIDEKKAASVDDLW